MGLKPLKPQGLYPIEITTFGDNEPVVISVGEQVLERDIGYRLGRYGDPDYIRAICEIEGLNSEEYL